jgi:hypothetical protein
MIQTSLQFSIFILFLVFFISNNLIKINILSTVSDKNRKINGNLVWINLLPFVNVIFPFLFNQAMNESINSEIDDRGKEIKFFSFYGNLYPILILICIPYYIKIYGENSLSVLNEIELFYFISLLISILVIWSLYLAELLSVQYYFKRHKKKGNHTKVLLFLLLILIVAVIVLFIYDSYFSNEARGIGSH